MLMCYEQIAELIEDKLRMTLHKFHVYTADLNPRFGTEAGKIRPVVVVQTNLLNEDHMPVK